MPGPPAVPDRRHGGAYDPEEYIELVLAVVERIPPGRVMSYGAIAEYLGLGGPRQVGAVMARHGGGVPWHRVVASTGRVVPGNAEEALRRLRADCTPIRGEKVDMRTAAWAPDVESS
jgi:methylated-DNA-protein-cysteine methyltransferase-like protein